MGSEKTVSSQAILSHALKELIHGIIINSVQYNTFELHMICRTDKYFHSVWDKDIAEPLFLKFIQTQIALIWDSSN